MKQFFSWIRKHAGLLIVLLFLTIHLAIINDYGLTWDFHHHFFAGGKFLGLSWQELEPDALPYIEPDPRRTWSLPYGPFISIIPTASYVLFSAKLGWLAPDAAYNLPIVLSGVLGIMALYLFLRQAWPHPLSVFGALFLALTPRYFSDIHNNMKDAPMAAVFAVNIWLLWRLVHKHRPIDLLLSVLAFAIAFNTKINSIFIPLVFASWLILLGITKVQTQFPRRIFWYFLLAPLAAYLLWWGFWADPMGQIMHAVRTFGFGTDNIEVLVNGNWHCSGKNVPWYYPYWFIGITTPLRILGFFLFSIGSSLALIFSKKRTNLLSLRLLLLAWFFVPLTRYFLPKIGVIDGVRHFEEVLYPLCALAAIGFYDLVQVFSKRRTDFWKSKIFILATVGIIGSLIWNVVSYHPFQITYYNELVGGITGAYGKYDLDYWGGSQKYAVEWVNRTAAPNAKVFIFMAPDVASRYLRPDLRAGVNTVNPENADYTIILNRQSFYYRLGVFDYIRQHVPVYTVTTHEVPLVWVFGKEKNTVLPARWWQGEDPCIIKYW